MYIITTMQPTTILDIPSDVMERINLHATMRIRVNNYVDKYHDGDVEAETIKTRMINKLDKEIERYYNERGRLKLTDLHDECDVIIGDRGMGGKRRTKRTKCNKRTKRTKRTYKRRK